MRHFTFFLNGGFQAGVLWFGSAWIVFEGCGYDCDENEIIRYSLSWLLPLAFGIVKSWQYSYLVNK